MEPRADCWKHFDKFIDESGATKAKCKYCRRSYVAATKGNGTSSMNNDLKKYPTLSRIVDGSQTLISFLPSST